MQLNNYIRNDIWAIDVETFVILINLSLLTNFHSSQFLNLVSGLTQNHTDNDIQKPYKT